jgi:pimeloyl-ACP methyl ester carboxylesterase
MNYIDVFFRSDDGLRLYARDYPGPAADSPVVICLPGLTRNSKDFEGLAEVLRQTHRVVCPDQRGRGRSEYDTDPSRYRPDRYVQDMRVLLDLLSVQRVTVIGTSLGGLMAMLMMATDASRITAIVLNDVGPVVEPAGLARIAAYVGKSAAPQNWSEAAAQTADTNGLAFPDYQQGDWQAMARDLYIQENSRPVLNYDPAIAQGIASGTAAPNLWPLFEMVGSRPMLVVRGAASDILSQTTVDEMCSRLPQVVAVNIVNRGHAPTLNEPAAREAIAGFLAKSKA